MRKLDHCNIVRLRYFFYSSGEKVSMKGLDLSCPDSTVQGWCTQPTHPTVLLHGHVLEALLWPSVQLCLTSNLHQAPPPPNSDHFW